MCFEASVEQSLESARLVNHTTQYVLCLGKSTQMCSSTLNVENALCTTPFTLTPSGGVLLS